MHEETTNLIPFLEKIALKAVIETKQTKQIKVESCLKKLRANDLKNVLFGCLNINSLLKMIEYLEEIIKNMFDVFLVLKRKLDS